MRRATYEKKLGIAETKISGDMLVQEERQIKRTQSELWRFWKNVVRDHFKGGRYDERYWVTHEILGNLRPTGTLTVNVRNGDPYSSGEVLHTEKIKKTDYLN